MRKEQGRKIPRCRKILEQVSASGCIWIWCVEYQLDLFIQSLMREVEHDSFYKPMISLLSFLRRQTTLINEIGRKCPTICTTKWSSIVSAKKWLVSNWVQLQSTTTESQTHHCMKVFLDSCWRCKGFDDNNWYMFHLYPESGHFSYRTYCNAIAPFILWQYIMYCKLFFYWSSQSR